MHLFGGVHVLLADDAGVFEGQREAQHDEVCVCAVEAVRVIWVELALVGPDVLHDLVLSLAWGVRAREDNGQPLPVVVLLDLFEEEEVEHLVQLSHELGPWRDGVILEVFLTVGQVSIAVQLLEKLLVVLGTAEPPGPLLVHLAPGSNSVKREHDGLGGLEQVDDGIDVIKDLDPYFLELLGHQLRLEDYRIVLHR